MAVQVLVPSPTLFLADPSPMIDNVGLSEGTAKERFLPSTNAITEGVRSS